MLCVSGQSLARLLTELGINNPRTSDPLLHLTTDSKVRPPSPAMSSTTYEQYVPSLWILSLCRFSREPNPRYRRGAGLGKPAVAGDEVAIHTFLRFCA